MYLINLQTGVWHPPHQVRSPHLAGVLIKYRFG